MGNIRRRFFREHHQRLGRRRLLQPLNSTGIAHHALEEPIDHIQRVLPRISRIRRVVLKDGDRRRLAGGIARILDRAGDARSVAKRGLLIEKPSDFQIDVDSGLDPSKQFQKEPLAVNDRRVALLRFQDLCV